VSNVSNFTFNTNASDRSQVNQGQNVNATQTNSGERAPISSAADFFSAVREAAPPEAQPVISELESMVDQEAGYTSMQTSEGFIEFTNKKTSLLERLKDFLPAIAKGSLAFGSGYFRAYVSKSPLINGIVEMLDAVQSA
jgi:hypothetical protein